MASKGAKDAELDRQATARLTSEGESRRLVGGRA
jgi:hypothetical protein